MPKINAFEDFLLEIEEFYGNRGFKFDFILAAIFVGVLWLFKFNFLFLGTIRDSMNTDASISFLGILIGFLLTAFSILLTFNPYGSDMLKKLREAEDFKKLLHSYLSTAMIFVVDIILIVLSKLLSINTNLFYMLIACIAVFSLLRFFKCIYYLYAIIELS
jgi:hypothetical protein